MKAYKRTTARADIAEAISEIFEVVRCTACGISYLDCVCPWDKPVRLIPAPLQCYEWPMLSLYYVQWVKNGPLYVCYMADDSGVPSGACPLDYCVVNGKFRSLVPKRIRLINKMNYAPTGYRYRMR